MHIDFAEEPKKEAIKSMMEAVMNRYHYPINEENIFRFGDGLVVLRKLSSAGINEMDILRHMYQYGDTTKTIGEQAVMSAYILEKMKGAK